MSLSNPARRPLQPTDSEIDADFLRDYIIQTTGAGAAEGRQPDPDSTLGLLVRNTLNALFPPREVLDSTVRVGLQSHSVFFAEALRHFVQFTFLLAMCQLAYSVDRERMLILSAWCFVVFTTYAMLKEFAKQDGSMFFAHMEELLAGGATVILFLLMIETSISVAVFWTLGGFLALVLLRVTSSGSSQVSRGGIVIRFVAAVMLTVLFPSTDVLRQHPILSAVFVVFLGNFLVLLPIPFAMQHWYVANRFATLDDVRSFGPGAPVYAANKASAINGILSVTFAVLQAAVLSAGVALFFAYPVPSPTKGFEPVLSSAAIILLANFESFYFSMCWYRYRIEDYWILVGHFYATWRALAVWLSYEPPLTIPAVFQFQRPWSSRPFRLALITLALAANSAGLLIAMRPTVTDYLTAEFRLVTSSLPFAPAVVPEENVYKKDFVESPSDRFDRFNYGGESYGHEGRTPPHQPSTEVTPMERQDISVTRRAARAMGAIAVAAVLPPLLLFLFMNAIWGGVFLAYTQRFELYYDEVNPPLLAFSPTATRQRRNA